LESSLEHKRLFCETKHWDISIDKKRWFFSSYFNCEELFTLYKQNNIGLFDKNDQYMFHKNPIIHALYNFCNEKNFLDLLASKVQDKEYFEIGKIAMSAVEKKKASMKKQNY